MFDIKAQLAKLTAQVISAANAPSTNKAIQIVDSKNEIIAAFESLQAENKRLTIDNKDLEQENISLHNGTGF